MSSPEREPLPIADQVARPAQWEADFQRALEATKLEALAEFAAGAGHEINNPLTVISGRAQLLLREERDPERRHALALISAQAMRVHEMIADMMLFARPPRPELQPVELVELIDDLLSEIKGSGVFTQSGPQRAAEQRLPTPLFSRTGDPGPILIEADPVQLRVALRTICQNSLDALQGGGHVEIEVRGPGIEGSEVGGQGSENPKSQIPNSKLPLAVLIRIRDDGPGITPEERRHIFDPFYSARQAGRGLGLGLSKAWRIITNHGGRIDVESQPGRGATFTIVLPTAPSGPQPPPAGLNG
jgi:signal transduction histidine kinase